MKTHAQLSAALASVVLCGTALMPSIAFAGTSSSMSTSSSATTSSSASASGPMRPASSGNGTSSAKAKISQSQALKLARQLFSIPSSYTVQNQSFGTNYGNNRSHPVYTFNFQKSTPGKPSDNISVGIDAVTKTVTSYNHYQSNQSFEFPVPTSQKQAESIANTWAKKLYPNKVQDTKMTAVPFQSNNLRSPVRYTFRYERMVSGVPAPFDGFSITIDQNGHLESINEAWHNVKFPSTSSAVSAATAQKTFLSALGLHLEYRQLWHQNSNPTTVLAYAQGSMGYPTGFPQQFSGNFPSTNIVIDAMNGDLLDGTGATHKPVAPTPPTPLDPKATSQSLTSHPVNWNEQQALAYAKQIVPLASDAKLTHENEWSNANSDSTWNFQFTEKNQSGNSSSQVNVGIDATYGYLTQFNSFVRQMPTNNQGQSTNKQKSLSQQTLQAAAVAFAKKAFAGHLHNIAIQPQTQFGPPSTSQFRVFGLVNGIPDQSLSGSINVDSTTGKVANMYFGQNQHDNTNLPSPKQAVGVSVAQKAYANEDPVKLTYVMTNPMMAAKMRGKVPTAQNQQKPKVMLAYVPTAKSSSNTATYFDAIKGKFVADNGGGTNPYSGQINDISGNANAAQLTLLARRGLLPVDSKGDIHPSQTLTNAAFIKLVMDSLQTVNMYNTSMGASSSVSHAMAGISKNNPSYKELTVAYSLGWLNPNQPLKPNATMTRSEAAQILAHALGYDSLLSKPTLFNMSAKDAAKISQSDLAGDAISASLNMLPLDKSGNFDGSKPVTVGVAAHAVVKASTLMSAEQVGPIRPMG